MVSIIEPLPCFVSGGHKYYPDFKFEQEIHSFSHG